MARMNLRQRLASSVLILCAAACAPGFAASAEAHELKLPAGTSEAIENIYSFRLNAAIEEAQQIQNADPDHPVGYLLEAEALWWRIWCTSSEYKYGMTDARHRAKLASDQNYIDLIGRAASIAQQHLEAHETAEMQFYAGLADAFAARLYGLRGENRATARAGIHARSHFLRALQLDPELVDADFGLGLYNYYVDTLGALAKVVGFFMGVPGGNKQDGIRQLQQDIERGVLTANAARFYLALNLHRYDQQYEKALSIIDPLAEKYPTNPLFQLARGDLYGKLGRKEQAIAAYQSVLELSVRDAECADHLKGIVSVSMAAQGMADTAPTH